MLQGKIIDADAHILEPPDLWVNNLEAKYRERAIRFEKDPQGWDYLIIDGKPSFYTRGWGIVAGMGHPGEKFLSPNFSYRDAPAGAYEPHARVKDLDAWGIDIAILYPSIGLIWEDAVRDPALALAYCRVYNDWLVDWCRASPERLIPIAHLSLLDVEGAIKELHRVAKNGMKGVMLNPYPANTIPYGHPQYDPFWAAAQELDLPVAIHPVGRSNALGLEWYSGFDTGTPSALWYLVVATDFDVRAAFTTFFQGAVFERFPRLKVIVLEVGAGWLAHWLERMDSKWQRLGFLTD